MDVLSELINKYLGQGRMMQVATVLHDQPWNCTLYYVTDQRRNLYWISKTDARHSVEINQNPKIAATIPIKFDDLDVVGLQFEGTAHLVQDLEEIKTATKLYSDKFNRGDKWYQDFLEGKNVHKLYRITPTYFVIFDRVNFPNDDKQLWKPS